MRFTTYLETIEEIRRWIENHITVLLETIDRLINVFIVTNVNVLLDWIYNFQMYFATNSLYKCPKLTPNALFTEEAYNTLYV